MKCETNFAKLIAKYPHDLYNFVIMYRRPSTLVNTSTYPAVGYTGNRQGRWSRDKASNYKQT